jgi:hypothetical protein
VSLVHFIDFFELYSTNFLVLSQDPDHEVQPINKADEPPLTILYRTDGFPLLPAIDFDTISPTSGRPLLAAYILGMWGKHWQFLLML